MDDARKLVDEMEGVDDKEKKAELLHERVNEELEREAMRSQPKTMLGREEIINRFGYHKATETTGPEHHSLRRAFIELAEYLNDVLPEGRAKSVCFTELESAAMWGNKAIAEQAPVVYE